jgi:hypothetical protein
MPCRSSYSEMFAHMDSVSLFFQATDVRASTQPTTSWTKENPRQESVVDIAQHQALAEGNGAITQGLRMSGKPCDLKARVCSTLVQTPPCWQRTLLCVDKDIVLPMQIDRRLSVQDIRYGVGKCVRDLEL